MENKIFKIKIGNVTSSSDMQGLRFGDQYVVDTNIGNVYGKFTLRYPNIPIVSIEETDLNLISLVIMVERATK